jgi:hypothetical protein
LPVPVVVYSHSHTAYAKTPLEGRATLDIQSGSLRIDGARSRPVLGVVGGVILGAVALFGVIALFMVAAHFGLDLMKMRRGTTLIAVLALAAGVGGFGVGGVLIDKVFGQVPYDLDIRADQLDVVAVDGKLLMLAFKPTPSASKAILITMIPADGDTEALAQRIRQTV